MKLMKLGLFAYAIMLVFFAGCIRLFFQLAASTFYFVGYTTQLGP